MNPSLPPLRVKVHFVGPVRRPGPERAMVAELAAGCDVAALLAALGYADSERAGLIVLRDGARLSLGAALDNDDLVEILLPLGGGA